MPVQRKTLQGVKHGDAVYILWHDACSSDHWAAHGDHTSVNPPLIRSCGFLLQMDKEKVIIALSIDESNDNVSQSLCIPYAMVKDVVILTGWQSLSGPTGKSKTE